MRTGASAFRNFLGTNHKAYLCCSNGCFKNANWICMYIQSCRFQEREPENLHGTPYFDTRMCVYLFCDKCRDVNHQMWSVPLSEETIRMIDAPQEITALPRRAIDLGGEHE